MTKTIFKKVVWLGRATTFMVGLAVILALSVGLASAALAGTGVGAGPSGGSLDDPARAEGDRSHERGLPS